MPEPVVVAGGSVGALAAADALARGGRPVELLLPDRGVGSGFAPRIVEGRRLDLGVRLLERGYGDPDGPVPPLADYRPGPHGHRPYAPLVAAWLDDLVGDALVDAGRPGMVRAGRLLDDILLTVDLRGLRAVLGARERAAVAREAAVARARDGDGGVLAAGAPDGGGLSLAEASTRNHGPTFHRLVIEPLCTKIDARGSAAVLATLGRRYWVPLFHPRTLWEAAAGAPLGFRPDRRFHVPAPDGVGLVVERLLARLGRSPGVTVRRVGRLEGLGAADDGRVRLRFADGTERHARRPVLGTPAAETLAAAGAPYAPERVRSVVAWAEVAATDVSALPPTSHVLDPAQPLFRVSRNGHQPDPDRTILVLELRHDIDPGDVPALAAGALAQAGILRPGAPADVVDAVAAPTFPVPGPANLERFARARAVLDALGLDLRLVGAARAFAADSLNEQVVQALAIASEETPC